MKTKMAVFDLDKTLLDDYGRLPASFAADLAQLEARGVQFVAASSRPASSVQKLFAAYLPHIFGVCDNGNVIFKGNTTEVIYRFTWEDVVHFRQFVQEEAGMALGVSGNGQGYTDAESDRKFREIGLYKRFTPCRDVQELATGEILISGINLLCLDPKDVPKVKSRLLQGFPKYNFLEAGFGWLAVLPRGVDKASGVRVLLEQMHIATENAISFGDSENDLPLFELLPHSYAMKNANVFVQSCAFGVTDADNNGNGAMLKALEHFG